MTDRAPCNARLIYERVLDSCPPFNLEPPWSRLNLSVDARSCPPDPAALIGKLRADFSIDQLVESGVAIRGPDGSVHSSDKLCNIESILVPLRHEPGDAPYDILTPAGCLFANALPALAMLEDHVLRAAICISGIYCLSVSLADVAILRGLGIPAGLANGLDGMRGNEAALCCTNFGWQSRILAPVAIGPMPPATNEPLEPVPVAPPDDSNIAVMSEIDSAALSAPIDEQIDVESDGERPSPVKICDVIFVCWSLSELQDAEPAEIDPIRTYLRDLADACEIDLAALRCWSPGPAEIKQCQFRCDLDDINLVGEHLRRSLGDAQGTFFEPAVVEIVHESFVQASKNYHEKCRNCGRKSTDPEYAAALVRLIEAWDRDCYEPLVSKAMAEEDPVDRSLLLNFAAAQRQAFRDARAVDQQCAELTITSIEIDPKAEKHWKSQLQASGHSIQIVNALSRRSRNK